MKRALLLLPVLLLLPACGGGDAASAKEAFVVKAEAICAVAKADREKQVQPTSPTALAGYVDTLVGILEKAQLDLAVLELPADDSAALKAKVFDPLAADVAAGKAFAAKVTAAKGDGATILGLLGSRPKTTIDLEYAKTYGLPTCAAAAG